MSVQQQLPNSQPNHLIRSQPSWDWFLIATLTLLLLIDSTLHYSSVQAATTSTWETVPSSIVSIKLATPVRNRRSNDATVDITVSNLSGQTQVGPFRLVITGLTPTAKVSIGNATGSTDIGLPYFNLSSSIGTSFTPGKSTLITANVIGGGPNIFSFSTRLEKQIQTISCSPPQVLQNGNCVAPVVSNNLVESTAFLYTGSNPIQTGVLPNTIEVKRAAVVRGKVMDKQNNPLTGVTVTIKDHPEFGQTLTRADGMFDMAVNGGGVLTINYQKNGYMPVQRQGTLPWQDYLVLDDVVMMAKDSKVTNIDLTSPAAIQVVKGSPVTDTAGTRQATVLIPKGTSAQIYNADGSTKPITNLSFRFTEFTSGTNGKASMPAPLPPTSAYTYAVSLEADEVNTSIAGKEVLFSQPVYFYLENFLKFPTGIQVPVGLIMIATTQPGFLHQMDALSKFFELPMDWLSWMPMAMDKSIMKLL